MLKTLDMTLGRIKNDSVRGPQWLAYLCPLFFPASLDAQYAVLVCAGPWISHLGLVAEQLEIRGFNSSLHVFLW